MCALLTTGGWQALHGAPRVVPTGAFDVDPASAKHGIDPTGFALLFLLLRGFAEGCAAMTGTEAISNGVQAFRAPSQRNAAVTLAWMEIGRAHV